MADDGRAVGMVALRDVRERAIQQLSDAFARDLLELDEFERRLTIAHRAEAPAELEPLTADLPAPASASALVPIARAPGAVRDRQTLVAVMGGSQRSGRWTPPRKLRVLALMGGTTLDFREATLAPGVSEVYVVAMMGGAQIIVPPQLAVEMNGIAIMGGFEHTERAPTEPDPDRPLLRVHGLVCMGGVNIETRLPGETAGDARRRRRRERKALRSAAKLRQLPGHDDR